MIDAVIFITIIAALWTFIDMWRLGLVGSIARGCLAITKWGALGLAGLVGSIAKGVWAIAKWVLGLAVVGAVLWLLGPLWSIAALLIIIIIVIASK